MIDSLNVFLILFVLGLGENHSVHGGINLPPPQKHLLPSFVPSPSPLNLQTVQAPPFLCTPPPSILVFHEPP